MAAEELQQLLDRKMTELDDLRAVEGLDARQAGAVADFLQNTITELAASLGECRQAVPYSAMRPVRDANGNLKWCCNHDPEHC